jgi:hypothetical protein
MKKYIVPLLTLITVSLLLLGLKFLWNLIFESSTSIVSDIDSYVGLVFVLIAMERGIKPTELGKKNDLIVLFFLSMVVIIFTIIIRIYGVTTELLKIIWLCISVPVLGFVVYFGSKRFLRKKQK